MKRLLSLLGSVAMIGTAGATVAACGNNNKPKENPEESPIEIAKEKLTKIIEEAKGLVNTSKKEEAITEALKSAINDAQVILAKVGVTETELTSATTTLQAAIDEFKNAEDADIIAAKNTLLDLINKAKDLLKNSKKEESTNKNLKVVIDQGEKIWKEKDTTIEELEEATAQLKEAIKQFNDSPDIKNPKEKLQEKITEANRLIVLAEKSEDAIATLKSEIAKAQAIFNKSDATEDELINALNNLQRAMENYNNSDDGLEGLRYQLQKQIWKALATIADNIGKKTDLEIAEFTKIIDKAQGIYDTSKDENEVKSMIEELQKAIKDFAGS